MREEQSARPEAWEDHIEKAFVVAFPGVEEHEVELALELRDLFERVARHDGHDIGETRPAKVLGGHFGAGGIELDRCEMTARLTETEPNPDCRVAVGATDLERARGAVRGDHDA